jgi:ubiquinone/menaquinone biosynthesis C-methylase UbiE/uncharacterized protein YbaR (Trm112 family)
MKASLIKLLVCPFCHLKPELIIFGVDCRPVSPRQNLDEPNEVFTGILKCKCGQIFPIIEGVPRFLENGLKSFPEFVVEQKNKLADYCELASLDMMGVQNATNDYENIRKSFSQEWSIFDYDNDKTWGWTLQERKAVFLGDVQMKSEVLHGKRMLDAGCGNGTLTAALSDFGLEIVGLDLNDGLGRANTNREKYGQNAAELVQYVQGNLVSPPLREETFDLVYSSGVIHHTPSSRHTFDSLVKLTKKGGRLYVWVYGKRPWPARVFFFCGRGLKRWISLKSLMNVCRLLAPMYKVVTGFLNMTRIYKFRRRTAHEITLDLFDAFAPRYNHWHTEAEVRSWFEERGFQNIQTSGIQKHGFGMYGDRH